MQSAVVEYPKGWHKLDFEDATVLARTKNYN